MDQYLIIGFQITLSVDSLMAVMWVGALISMALLGAESFGGE